MRILLIHNYYQYYGGEDTYFDSLKKLLIENGHTVKVYARNSKDITSIFDKVKAGFGIFWNIQVGKEIDTLINEFKPNIVQIQNIYPLIGPIVYWVCKKNKVRIIQRISNYRLLCPKGTLFRDNKICELCIHRKIKWPAVQHSCYHSSKLASLIFVVTHFLHQYLKTFSSIDRYIFPSGFSKKYILRDTFIPRKKAIVIPNFTLTRVKKVPAHKRKYFLYVGRLSEEKGIVQIFNLFSTLPQLQLIIIGDGPLKTTLSKYKYSNIIFKGFLNREKVHFYMKRALFTIIPSRCYDVFPNTLVESFSCGTPVIVPRLGSFIDLIKEGKTGLFYQSDDLVGLKSLLLKAGRINPFKMGQLAQEEFEVKYNKQVYLKNILNEYQLLIK